MKENKRWSENLEFLLPSILIIKNDNSFKSIIYKKDKPKKFKTVILPNGQTVSYLESSITFGTYNSEYDVEPVTFADLETHPVTNTTTVTTENPCSEISEQDLNEALLYAQEIRTADAEQQRLINYNLYSDPFDAATAIGADPGNALYQAQVIAGESVYGRSYFDLQEQRAQAVFDRNALQAQMRAVAPPNPIPPEVVEQARESAQEISRLTRADMDRQREVVRGHFGQYLRRRR